MLAASGAEAGLRQWAKYPYCGGGALVTTDYCAAYYDLSSVVYLDGMPWFGLVGISKDRVATSPGMSQVAGSGLTRGLT